MKCPNEDCLGWLGNPQKPCPACGYEPTDRDKEQVAAEHLNAMRPQIAYMIRSQEWGGVDQPFETRY